ncbi:hypothetical protein CROQUDRAFT_41633 [Cronartium quercuum f. sp. fusiforme G11]|uniref:Uncharacterized protein n=1 Tax=Cronartium quercuum f. sp. fusiforme G11 TaxID=708437 RepID=A0A9P6TDY8_9BASI|nr:hypothetical protein CROQUDRAFT_41633 [Cronartium quercuum f. sp. fusiforme G11]
MATTTTSISSPPLTTHVGQLVQTHRRALLISLTIAIAAAAGTIYLTSSSSSTSSGRSTPDKEKKKKKDGKKTKKNRKKSPGSSVVQNSDTDGAPDRSDQVASGADDVELDPRTLTKAQLEALSESKRASYAFALKTKGNKAYQARQFEEAIECYSKAIECEEKAVYYSNRAACYTHLNDSEAVIKDCTDALRLDKNYIKALNRRAAARELLGGEENLLLALFDFTACVILDEFKTDTKGVTADRVMKRYASEKAKRLLQERGPRLPSSMIIRAYLNAFRSKPKPELPPEPSQADRTLDLAYDALAAYDYPHACTLFMEAVEQGPSTADLRAHALMMKATFLFLMGQSALALETFKEALAHLPSLIQAWVRKASVDVELGSLERAMEDFEAALALDPSDPDIYYHRAQVYNVTEQHHLAIADYEKSIELDSSFVFSHVQLAVAVYKTGDAARALKMFEGYLQTHPDVPEVHNYYGELLFAEQRFEEAMTQFDLAIDLDKNRPGPRNVHPIVNKAMVHATAFQNYDRATSLCEEALAIDDRCEGAIQQVAQFKLQSNDMVSAAEWFGKGVEVAMTEMGLSQFLQFEVAVKAQEAFVAKYPEVRHVISPYDINLFKEN